ncbi:MAG: outer membrane protein assembly factor BamB [Planctomycetota bacterium]
MGPGTGKGVPSAAWEAAVGRGYSCPSVSDGRVVIQGYFASDEDPLKGHDRVTCLDLVDGTSLWGVSYPTEAYANEHKGGALSTATIVNGVAYVASRGGEVRALALKDGAILWQADLVERHSVDPSRYGFGSSPLVLDDELHLNLGMPVALDRATGETLWIGEDLEARFSTSVPMDLNGRACLVVFGGKGAAVVDRADGSLVHLQEFRKGNRNVEGASPIVMGTRVFVSSAYDHGGMLIEFGGEQPEVLWRSRKMRTKMAGSVLYEGHFYGFDESMLNCVDMNGKQLWRVRGMGQGALAIAGGELITTTSQGELVIGKASPLGFDEELRIDVIDGGVFWAAPTPVGNRILMRGSAGQLVCLVRDAEEYAADADATEQSKLPVPSALFAAHRAAMGLGAKQSLPYLRLEGRLHMNALGLVDVKGVWEVCPDGQWHAEFGLPPAMGGSFHRYFDGEHAWETNPYRGDSLIHDHRLTELLSTGGMRSVLRGPADFTKVETIGYETYAEQQCVRVDASLEGGGLRSFYFDVKSGLMAGRTGKDEAIVQLSDWREVGGIHLPFKRVVFDPDTGLEERWTFSEAALAPVPEERFSLPEGLRKAPGDGDEER